MTSGTTTSCFIHLFCFGRDSESPISRMLSQRSTNCIYQPRPAKEWSALRGNRYAALRNILPRRQIWSSTFADVETNWHLSIDSKPSRWMYNCRSICSARTFSYFSCIKALIFMFFVLFYKAIFLYLFLTVKWPMVLDYHLWVTLSK